MLCDIERDLGSVLHVKVAEKEVTGYMYFPIYGEVIDANDEKEKPIIGYEFMDVKGERFNIKDSRDPFIYNFDKLVNAAFLGLMADCPDWGVYADFFEDMMDSEGAGAEIPRGKDGSRYTGKKVMKKYTHYKKDEDGKIIDTIEEEVEEDELVALDITADIQFLRDNQDATSFTDRVHFVMKTCKWIVS